MKSKGLIGIAAACLATSSRVEPGKTSITFCDGVPDKDQRSRW